MLNAGATDEYVDDKKAAEALGLSRSYLRKLRARGQGPAFVKTGSACRYAVSALAAWARARTFERGKTLADFDWFAANPARRYRVREWRQADGPPATFREPSITIVDHLEARDLAGIPANIILPDPDHPGLWFLHHAGWENSDTYASLRWALEDLLWQTFGGRGCRPS